MFLEGGIVETESLIGISLAIAGNILISFALNIQKLAHNQLSHETYEKRTACFYSSSNSTSSFDSTKDILNCDNHHHHHKLSDETEYLQSKTWWLGIILLILGEMGNFLAYGFAPASTIATLGITTLVSNAILAPCLLNEQFRTRDFFGVLFAVCGAAAVVWSSKSHDIKLSPELVVAYLTQMRSFLFYIITISLIIFLSLISPQYGASNIFIDLGIVALYGAYTVLSTKSLSSLVNLTLYNLFTYPISYILIIVLIFTAIMQIKYLNKALQRFDGVAVIPTQFVLFTISAIIGSAVIYHDFDNDDIGNLIKFTIGCTIEFFGVFLITTNRRKENQHLSSPNLQSTSIIIHSPPPSIHITDPLNNNNNNNNNNNIPSVTTPLLNPHYDDVEHQSIHSGRRSSIIGGISLHSHLTTQEGDN
ncbi:unnamed protein product [Cunninghamella echinulata]